MTNYRQSSIKVGDRFTHLEVIGKSEKLTQTNPRRTLFICRCDCGVVKEIDAGNLKKGSVKSCGHLKRENAIKRGKAQRNERGYINIVFHSVKRGATMRSLNFDLTLDDFIEISAGEVCHWCGDAPTEKAYITSGVPFAIHGLDRLDNSIGYTKDNVLPCCRTCNLMRNNMEMGQFMNKILSIVAHQNKSWTESEHPCETLHSEQ